MISKLKQSNLSSWNKLAILSVISGVVFFVIFIPRSWVWHSPEKYGSIEGVLFLFQLILSVIAIFSGIWSYKQIKKSGQKGKLLAIVGIILGLYPLMVLIAIVLDTIIFLYGGNAFLSDLLP